MMMKTTVLAVMSLAIACASNVFAQTPLLDYQAKVYAERDKGLISYSEADQEMLAAAIALAPDDRPLHLLIESLIADAKKLEAGTLSKDEYFAKRTARINRHNEVTAMRNRQATSDNQRPQQSSSERLTNALRAGAESMNRSLHQQGQQQGQNCVFVATGNVMTRHCQ